MPCNVDSNSMTAEPFSFGVRLGLVFIVQTASLSAIAVLALLLYLAYSATATWKGKGEGRNVSSHMHYYLLNLLVSDLVQATGGILNIKWIAAAGVQAGGLCIVQGIAKQIGDVGVALTFVYFSTLQTIIQRPFRTLTIAIHTCCILVFRWNPPSRTAPIMVSMIWIFIILIVAFGHLVHGTNYYGPTQYWCWITEAYPGERLGLEYIWLYLAGFVNLICYAAIALVIKGILIMDGGRFRLQTRLERELNDFALNNRNERTKSNSIAMQMLFYPAVYIVTVSPISITRWLSFSGKSVPFPATAFASVLFSSSGLLNVILFTSTRPKLIRNRGGMVTGDNDNGMHFGSRVSIRQRGRLDNRQIGPWKAASRTSSFTSSRTPTTARPSSSQYILEGTRPLSS